MAAMKTLFSVFPTINLNVLMASGGHFGLHIKAPMAAG
jgi:hypothetical protein